MQVPFSPYPQTRGDKTIMPKMMAFEKLVQEKKLGAPPIMKRKYDAQEEGYGPLPKKMKDWPRDLPPVLYQALCDADNGLPVVPSNDLLPEHLRSLDDDTKKRMWSLNGFR